LAIVSSTTRLILNVFDNEYMVSLPLSDWIFQISVNQQRSPAQRGNDAFNIHRGQQTVLSPRQGQGSARRRLLAELERGPMPADDRVVADKFIDTLRAAVRTALAEVSFHSLCSRGWMKQGVGCGAVGK
jgi:hypothetical protein